MSCSFRPLRSPLRHDDRTTILGQRGAGPCPRRAILSQSRTIAGHLSSISAEGKRGPQGRRVESGLLALGAAATVLLSPQLVHAGPLKDLADLAGASVSYDEALDNGRPTVVEFYADWCEVCQETATMVQQVEAPYRSSVNFVMINIDNPKWAAEVDDFGVDGIPQFSFLDKNGNELAFFVGRIPRVFLEDNVAALASGESALPHETAVGESSAAESRPVAQVQPRSHSQAI